MGAPCCTAVCCKHGVQPSRCIHRAVGYDDVSGLKMIRACLLLRRPFSSADFLFLICAQCARRMLTIVKAGRRWHARVSAAGSERTDASIVFQNGSFSARAMVLGEHMDLRSRLAREALARSRMAYRDRGVADALYHVRQRGLAAEPTGQPLLLLRGLICRGARL